MSNTKLNAGDSFPSISVKTLSDNSIKLGQRQAGADWQMVVVYRGQHCPMCTKYLNQLESKREDFLKAGVEIVAVSADSKQQVESHLDDITVNFPLAYGLTIEQMQQLGLYLSDPRSPEETDHVFPEPGLFVINDKQKLHVVDISNNPFVRPELENLLSGLNWIKDPKNNYPIRGTHG